MIEKTQDKLDAVICETNVFVPRKHHLFCVSAVQQWVSEIVSFPAFSPDLGKVCGLHLYTTVSCAYDLPLFLIEPSLAKVHDPQTHQFSCTR